MANCCIAVTQLHSAGCLQPKLDQMQPQWHQEASGWQCLPALSGSKIWGVLQRCPRNNTHFDVSRQQPPAQKSVLVLSCSLLSTQVTTTSSPQRVKIHGGMISLQEPLNLPCPVAVLSAKLRANA